MAVSDVQDTFNQALEETGLDRASIAIAGLWTVSHFDGPDGKEECPSYSMITTTSNEIVKPVHPDWMPAILAPENYDQWLNGTTDNARELLKPYPADGMQIFELGENEKADAHP